MAKNSKVKKSDSIDWDYSVALESTDHISISQEYKLFIGGKFVKPLSNCLLYTSPSPRDATLSRMPSSA